MQNETTKVQRISDKTFVDGTCEKRARISTLLSAPDFCLSAAVIVATYDADVTVDGTWNAILDCVNADVDVALTTEG